MDFQIMTLLTGMYREYAQENSHEPKWLPNFEKYGEWLRERLLYADGVELRAKYNCSQENWEWLLMAVDNPYKMFNLYPAWPIICLADQPLPSVPLARVSVTIEYHFADGFNFREFFETNAVPEKPLSGGDCVMFLRVLAQELFRRFKRMTLGDWVNQVKTKKSQQEVQGGAWPSGVSVLGG